MKRPDIPLSCIDIVEPYARELWDQGINDVQFMGGIGSVALTMSKTEILPSENLVVTPETYELHENIQQFRPDGTLRDFDVLRLTDESAEVDVAEKIAQEIIGDQLELSFFGLHAMSRLRHQIDNPAMSLAKVWVGDRYVTTQDGIVVDARKALFPFAADLPPEALEPWILQVGQREPMPIPNPATSALNYMTRSLSGVRPKDAKKVANLVGILEKKAPELIDWMVDGPGKSQIELATIFQSLREPRRDPQPLKIGATYEADVLTPGQILESGTFLAEGTTAERRTMLTVSRAKSRAVYCYESNPRLVTLWQEKVEPRISKILKNEI